MYDNSMLNNDKIWIYTDSSSTGSSIQIEPSSTNGAWTTTSTTWSVTGPVLPDFLQDKNFVGYLFIDEDGVLCHYDDVKEKVTKIQNLKNSKEYNPLLGVIAKLMLNG
jgi:hypothetical protein